MVEEHSVVGRSMIERTCGRSRRENAGISSESKVRILAVESLRFPGEGSSAQGKSGPKERPKGVSDGQQVEIPALQIYLKDARDAGVEDKRGRGKTRIARYSENKVTNYQEAHWREKLVDIVCKYPYRKPTQVDEERILRRTGEALLRNSAN